MRTSNLVHWTFIFISFLTKSRAVHQKDTSLNIKI
jgi:hypothetical protein